MNISEVVRSIADNLKPGEQFLIRMGAENIQTARVALSQHAPGKFRTETKNVGLLVERLTGPRLTNKDHVMAQLADIKDTRWAEMFLGSMTIDVFRKYVPTKEYETSKHQRKLYVRKRTERCYKDRVWLQIADMGPGHRKLVDAYDRPFEVFRANIPPGFTVRRNGSPHDSRHWVTKLSELSDDEYMSYVAEKFMMEYDFDVIPHKNMRKIIARTAAVMGLDYHFEHDRVRVRNIVARLEALGVGQTTNLTGIDDHEAQRWLMGRDNYEVNEKEVKRVR